MEIDFLIAKSKVSSWHNISPIEVKSGSHYTILSLQKFVARFAEQTAQPYVLHTNDFKEENGITYLPVYMTSLLWKYSVDHIPNNLFKISIQVYFAEFEQHSLQDVPLYRKR